MYVMYNSHRIFQAFFAVAVVAGIITGAGWLMGHASMFPLLGILVGAGLVIAIFIHKVLG